MIPSKRFWNALDEHHGPGVVLLGLFVSWRTVADKFGMDAVDLASGVLDVIVRCAMSSAQMSSRLSTTVVGGYWPAPESQGAAIQWFEQWLPMYLEVRGMRIPIKIVNVSIARNAGESGRALYGRVQRELDRIMCTLPERERYPTLPVGWDEVTGS